MVAEEFKTDQTFRYPQEYDCYSQDKEAAMKFMYTEGMKTKENRADGGNAKFDWTDTRKEETKARSAYATKKKQVEFEKAMVAEA